MAHKKERAAFREQIIQNILRRGGGDSRPGIFGAKVCQGCASITTFRGLYGAMARHQGPRRSLLCSACEADDNAEVKAALDAGRRFCEFCCAAMYNPPEELEASRCWLCQDCRDYIGSYPVDQLLADLEVRRYLDIEFRTDAQLRSFDLSLGVMGIELGNIEAGRDPDSRRPDESERILTRIERVHGIEYPSDARDQARPKE